MTTATTDRNTEPRLQPFGRWTKGRQTAGALVIMAGAIPIALLAPTSYGRVPRLWSVLIVIGIVGLVAWLVDGRRYVGAAAASLAVGAALGTAAEADLDRYTYALLFGFLGAALLAVFRVNPAAVIGSAGLLLFTSASAAIVHLVGIGGGDPQPTIPHAWAYVVLMVLWGAVVLRQVRGDGADAGPAEAQPAPARETERAGAR